MDDSVSNIPEARERNWLPSMLRALLSAAIFGYIGSRIGRNLGIRGNAPESNMARPIMKWGMGGFWAFLAAYCSLKADAREQAPRPHERTAGQSGDDVQEATAAAAKGAVDIPAASIDVGSAAHVGEVASVAEKQRA